VLNNLKPQEPSKRAGFYGQLNFIKQEFVPYIYLKIYIRSENRRFLNAGGVKTGRRLNRIRQDGKF